MNIGRENEQLEFKKTISELKEGLISISSILNKHKQGTLYFGVKDNGDVIGQDIGKDTERKISREISNHIKPLPWYEIETMYSVEGLSFIKVSFSGENIPYSAYGRYYERFSDEDKQMSEEEIARLFKLRQKDYSEWEEKDSNETIDDIDEERLKASVQEGIDCGRISYEYQDSLSAIKKFGLYNSKTSMISNAGSVLFSKNKPVLLKTAVYATTTKETFIKLNHFQGNIFECIDEGISFILSSINWKISISGSAKRSEIPEIPQTAIREMVVNAFAHGCYDANTNFSIEIFPDKVSIYSPGWFPIGFKPEDFAENSAQPISLNPKIVSVLFRTKTIESFGTGYERTFKACREANVKCSYENTKTGFRFDFIRNIPSELKFVMSDTEKEVYDVIKDFDYFTNEEIAEKIGKSTKTVYRALKTLKENGYIQREGTNGDSYWKILK